MKRVQFVSRVRIVTLATVLCAGIIVGRLYMLQIVEGDVYAAKANAQFTPLPAPLLDRHTIYFSDKNGTLITAASMADVGTSSQRKRFYPGGTLAAHAVGFVAYNNDNVQKGRYGLERYYDQMLIRTDEDLYSNFFVELFSAAKTLFGGTSETGSIITSIEPTVQTELERTLATYSSDWKPKLAGGIIMDPKTGEIIAMAIAPTFDLNTFNEERDPAIFSNPLVQNVYEMGSIIKPLTVAAGLDSGSITAQTTYTDEGCLTIFDKKICNFDLRARGTVPIQEILSQSLNLGVAFVAQKTGPDIMREYFLERYKLGVETGIDLPSEAHGLVDNLKGNVPVEFATASFGQGIAITPIETVRALAVLANGGKLITPHVVKAVRFDSGVERELEWGEGEEVISPNTATQVSRMLTEVVDTSLANGQIKNPRYSVAAKTGTAQIANPSGGGYYTDRFLHSFFGYFPSFDARFLVFFFAVEPTGASYSSQTWAQPFHSITQFLISYYNIPPDR